MFCYVQKLMHDFNGRDTTIWEIQFDMVDSFLSEVRGFISLVVQPYNASNLEFLEYWHIVIWSEGAILHSNLITLYLSTGLSDGELNAMNLLGMIQFKSPFSIF